MTYIPGQNDSLFEAVKSVVTGDTEDGTYARNVLGYTPTLSESVRVRQVPEDSRGPLRDRVLERMGQSGPPGWKYGQRVYYGGEPFRVVEFNEGVDSYGPLRLTIVRDDFSQEISGVLADYVTYPTHTTAIGEDTELEEMHFKIGEQMRRMIELLNSVRHAQHMKDLSRILRNIEDAVSGISTPSLALLKLAETAATLAYQREDADKKLWGVLLKLHDKAKSEAE